MTPSAGRMFAGRDSIFLIELFYQAQVPRSHPSTCLVGAAYIRNNLKETLNYPTTRFPYDVLTLKSQGAGHPRLFSYPAIAAAPLAVHRAAAPASPSWGK
ncbi:MAG: hypothetical protein JW384_01441 [Nitrosomonadaceae bacterium]|nr:hypothetical protein [Nitrosomonadaceae bacterium]